MPKHPFPASRWLLAPLLLAAIMQSGAAHANATGVGLILSVTTVFECADEDMNISEGTCNKDPDAHTAVVGSVNVSAIACRSPADIAGVKLEHRVGVLGIVGEIDHPGRGDLAFGRAMRRDVDRH